MTSDKQKQLTKEALKRTAKYFHDLAQNTSPIEPKKLRMILQALTPLELLDSDKGNFHNEISTLYVELHNTMTNLAGKKKPTPEDINNYKKDITSIIEYNKEFSSLKELDGFDRFINSLSSVCTAIANVFRSKDNQVTPVFLMSPKQEFAKSVDSLIEDVASIITNPGNEIDKNFTINP